MTRYDDVRAVSRDHETFSAELGSTFVQDQTPEALEMIRMTILNMDPPEALALPPARQRRVHAPHDRSTRRPASGERAHGIVASVEGRDEIEFVEDVAAELPLQMICEMIGVPDERPPPDLRLEQPLVGFQDEDFRTSEEDGEIAAAEIYAYCETIAADRRANGRDDIMTALVNAEIDGDRLTQDEINMFFVTLAVAGNETTRNLIAHSLQVLLERPDVKADLVANIDDDDAVGARPPRSSCGGVRRSTTSVAPRHATPRSPVSRSRQGDKVVIYYAGGQPRSRPLRRSRTCSTRAAHRTTT